MCTGLVLLQNVDTNSDKISEQLRWGPQLGVGLTWGSSPHMCDSRH